MDLQNEQRCITRVVACRGAVQLASAIAAMRTVAASGCHSRFKNHLIIYDLSAPEGQGEEFACCIQGLAEQVEEWDSVHYLPLPDLKRIENRVAQATDKQSNLAAELLGLSSCDELYLGQDDKFLTRWLRQNFRDAQHICFGDGIGLNFTNAYFRPKEHPLIADRRPLLKRLNRSLKGIFRNLASRLRRRTSRDFDVHCLLLKNLFDQHLQNVLSIDGSLFIELFREFAADFSRKAPDVHRQLSCLQARPGKNAVLLTSNFSETGRMSLDGEIDGYLQMLNQMPQGNDVALIIKPHPRDSYEKIRVLKESCEKSYGTTLALMDPWTFYFPFESLYTKYLADSERPTSIATVSSAAISLEYLYGQHCHLGFGKEIVTQSFSPLWQPLRQLHEDDLVGIIQHIRRTRPSFYVSAKAA